MARQRWGSWQRLAWRRPEWWTLGLSAIAWVLLIAEAITRPTGRGWSQPHHHGAGEPVIGAGEPVIGAGEPLSLASSLPAWRSGSVQWSLMVVAMMLPLVVPAIRSTARRSLWYRRNRAICGFLVGYVTPWLALGLATWAIVGAIGLEDRHGSRALAAMGFGVAAAWQVTPVRLRAVWSCHRTAPLAPEGWRAGRDCLRYGWDIGERCVVSCWAMMLACVLAGHSLLSMTCVGVLGAVERYRPRPRQLVLTGVLVGLAVGYAVLGP
jgi:predicted metal-binding membrane protein